MATMTDDLARERIIAKAIRLGKELAPASDTCMNFIEQHTRHMVIPDVYAISEGFVGGDALYSAIDELIEQGVHRNGRSHAYNPRITEHYCGTLLRRSDGSVYWIDLRSAAIDIEDERETDAEYDARHNDSLQMRG